MAIGNFKKKGSKKPAPAASKKKGKAPVDDDEEEDEEEETDDEEEEDEDEEEDEAPPKKSKFKAGQKKAAAPAPKKGSKKPAAAKGKKKSRWEDVDSEEPRDPILGLGRYRLKVVSNEQGHNPGKGTDSVKATVEVVECDDEVECEQAVGDVCVVIFMISGAGAARGMARCKAYIVAAAGCEDDEEFAKFSPKNKFIDAVLGVANEHEETIEGRLVDVSVTQGNEIKDKDTGEGIGKYWGVYDWSVVPEDEQDGVACVADQ